jgi:hypothetical protein
MPFSFLCYMYSRVEYLDCTNALVLHESNRQAHPNTHHVEPNSITTCEQGHREQALGWLAITVASRAARIATAALTGGPDLFWFM